MQLKNYNYFLTWRIACIHQFKSMLINKASYKIGIFFYGDREECICKLLDENLEYCAIIGKWDNEKKGEVYDIQPV